MKKKTIGIPRGMLYYEFYPMWERYFRSLNFNIISSPRTNKNILDKGILSCVDEACLPVKIFHGHVEYLKDKVDYIFIPKIMSLYKREYCCPKILGLAEMIENSIKDCPEIIDPIFDYKGRSAFKKAYMETGAQLRVAKKASKKAYKASQIDKNIYRSWLKKEVLKDASLKQENARFNLLILGHSYNVYDEFINMGIIEKLIEEKVNISFAEDVAERDIRSFSNQVRKRIFWTHGRRTVGAALSLIDRHKIDGIIYLNSFGCGLDSVLTHIVARKAKENNLATMELTLDEQTGEAGFNTRLEALLDMMKWRDRHEDNIPSFR